MMTSKRKLILETTTNYFYAIASNHYRNCCNQKKNNNLRTEIRRNIVTRSTTTTVASVAQICRKIPKKSGIINSGTALVREVAFSRGAEGRSLDNDWQAAEDFLEARRPMASKRLGADVEGEGVRWRPIVTVLWTAFRDVAPLFLSHLKRLKCSEKDEKWQIKN